MQEPTVFGEPDTIVDPDEDSFADEQSPRLLEFLFNGKHSWLQPYGSQFFGIAGILIIAVGFSVALGWFVETHGDSRTWPRLMPQCCLIALAAATYSCLVLALQVLASLQWPLTLRVVAAYATILTSLGTFELGKQLDLMRVPIIACFAAGGLLAREEFGWTAIGFRETARRSGRMSIGKVMDFTASLALTFALFKLSNLDSFSTSPLGWSCVLVSGFFAGAFGMLIWSRLIYLCTNDLLKDSSAPWWFMANLAMGLVVGVSLLSTEPLLAIIATSLVVTVAHVSTLLPLAWLRVCGWQFVRVTKD